MNLQNITVTQVTKEPREYNGRKYWGVKTKEYDVWIDFYDAQPERGKQYQVDLQSINSKGKTYWKAYTQAIAPQTTAPTPPPAPPSAPAPAPAPEPVPEPAQSTALSFDDYRLLVKDVHEIAVGLEPNTVDDHGNVVDRSQARIALVNTAVIAWTNGKLDLPIPF
jgi:hypothetical protein